MKQIIRAFALGLLSATAILGITFFINDTSVAKQPMPSVKDMISALEQEGYYIYEEEQVQSDPKDSTETEIEDNHNDKKIDQTETDTDENNNNDPIETEPKTSTLDIEPGMTVALIAEQLVDNGIIDNAEAFRSYLEEHEYSTRIQIGQFSLDETMTHQQIAETITK